MELPEIITVIVTPMEQEKMRSRKRLAELMGNLNHDTVGTGVALSMGEASACIRSRASCSACLAAMEDVLRMSGSQHVRELASEAVAYLTDPSLDPDDA